MIILSNPLQSTILAGLSCLCFSFHSHEHWLVSCFNQVGKGSRKCDSKRRCFGIWIILNWRHLKYSKCGERLSLNSPHLPKDRSSERSSFGIDPPRSVSSLVSRDKKLEVNTTPRHPLSQTIYLLPVLLRAHLSFPESVYSPPKRPTSPSSPFSY